MMFAVGVRLVGREGEEAMAVDLGGGGGG